MARKTRRLLAEQNEKVRCTVQDPHQPGRVYPRMVEQRKDSPGNWGNWDSMLKHLIAGDGDPTFERIDRRFVEGFRTYLAKEARTKSGTALSANSQNSYFLKFKAALNRAVEEGIVPQSPAMGVKATRTIEELQRLVKTDCSYPVLKDAFIFSCLTGMRWSDINKLTWGRGAGVRRRRARGLPPEEDPRSANTSTSPSRPCATWGRAAGPTNGSSRGTKYPPAQPALREWCMKAGITKHITFHCGRHTFAVRVTSLRHRDLHLPKPPRTPAS